MAAKCAAANTRLRRLAGQPGVASVNVRLNVDSKARPLDELLVMVEGHICRT